MTIPAQKKKLAVKQVLEHKKTVSEVARDLRVARKTIYSWVNRYKKTSPRIKDKAFEPKYVSGKKHPRAKAPQARYALIRLIISHPDWGSRKYSLELKRKGFDLGYFGVNKLLSSLGASTPTLRESFRKNWSGLGRLKSDIKLGIVKRVVEDKVGVSRVARENGVARKTIYQWIQRYHEATEKEVYGTAALKEAYPRGRDHPRAIFPGVQRQLLEIVIKKPELSIHRLAELMPVSSWTVWKILKSKNLNTYQQRLAYSQVYQPVIIPTLGLLEQVKKLIGQIPVISAIPPPLRLSLPRVYRGAQGKLLQGIQQRLFLLRPFIASFLSSIVFSTIIISWLGMIAQAPTPGAKLGLVFTSVSLLIGSFFFAYSMKYYLTLALVLSFSRQSLEEGEVASSHLRGIPLGYLGGGTSFPDRRHGFLVWLGEDLWDRKNHGSRAWLGKIYKPGSKYRLRRSANRRPATFSGSRQT